jgi:sulfoxide reductase catalytic subunit YedY
MVFVANIDFIQGWSGIAESGELPISKLVELVKPHTNVTTMAFYSFGEGLYGCLGDKL